LFNYVDSHQDAYTQTDASLEYVTEGNKWTFMIYGSNLGERVAHQLYELHQWRPTMTDFNWVFGASRTVGLRAAFTF
jgi:hypothetical protein